MITKKEIQVFREITLNGPQIASELTKDTRIPESYLSTILQKMTKKGLIKRTRNGKNKILEIAETAHASILQNMIQNNPQTNLNYLTNKGTQILATITCQNIRTKEELSEASNTSNMTLWKYMKKTQEIGLIQNNETITTSPRYEQVTEFVKTYTKYTNENKARKQANDALIKWSCGEKYLFETRETLNLQPTGISAFQNYGALFLTTKNLYTNTNEPLNLEDHLINHILSEKKENTLPLLITWRLNREKINPTYIKTKAYRYRISEITDAVQRYMDTKGREKQSYLINWTEFNNKYKEYSNE